MLQRPGIPRAGIKQIPQSWFEKLDAYLAALTWRPSKDIYPRMTPGGTTGVALSKAGAIGVENTHPFKIVGYVDDGENNIKQGMIGVVYGEINYVPPTLDDESQMTADDAPYAMRADDDGVVYVAVQLAANRKVESFRFSLAADDESVPPDGDFLVHFILGRFYIDETVDGGLPVPLNYVREHIYMEERAVMDEGLPVRLYGRNYARWGIRFGAAFFPFQVSGYKKFDPETWEEKKYISVAYGEINQVAPSIYDGGELLEVGKVVEFPVEAKGVAYAAVAITTDYEVISFYFSLARNDEEVPGDTPTLKHFILGRFYLDSANADMPVSYNIIRENLTIEEPADKVYPFEIRGYQRYNDENGKRSYVWIAYGEANQVPPDEVWEGSGQEFPVTAPGVVYTAITMDSNTYEVLSHYYSLARNDEEVPADDDTGVYLTLNIILGRFAMSEDGTPVPYNLVRENLNFSACPTIAPDGRLCLDLVSTFLRDPLARDSIRLNVFNAGDDEKSAMFLRVGDPVPEIKDKLVFQAKGNVFQAKWVTNPELWMYSASDGLAAKIDPWHIGLGLDMGDNNHIWLGRGSDETWHLEIKDSTAHIALGENQEMFFGQGMTGKVLALTESDNTHAAGLHTSYLDIDNSMAFFGYDETDAQYKLALNNGAIACGLHPGYLDLASQKVFLGYSSTEQTTHLAILSDTAYVQLGTSSQVFLGKGNDNLWKLSIVNSSNTKISFVPTQIEDCNGKKLWVMADKEGWK